MSEKLVREAINSNPEVSRHIQGLYVLYGNRALLIITANRDQPVDQLSHSLVACLSSYGISIQRRPLPYTTQLTVRVPVAPSSQNTTSPTKAAAVVADDDTSSLVLVGEITDRQLSLLASDKSEALKLVEAKTGLRLKKIKKNVYFAGLLFQFVLLNKIMADRVRDAAVAAVITDKNMMKNGNISIFSF